VIVIDALSPRALRSQNPDPPMKIVVRVKARRRRRQTSVTSGHHFRCPELIASVPILQAGLEHLKTFCFRAFFSFKCHVVGRPMRQFEPHCRAPPYLLHDRRNW
jgi:hypothetical protein